MGGVGRTLLHRPGDDRQARFPWERRHSRRPGSVALEPGYPFVEVALLPAPDSGLRRARPPHDRKSAMAVRCRRHDPGPPNRLARSVTVGDRSLELRTVSGIQIQADVIASHAPTMTHKTPDGNPMSGAEH